MRIDRTTRIDELLGELRQELKLELLEALEEERRARRAAYVRGWSEAATQADGTLGPNGPALATVQREAAKLVVVDMRRKLDEEEADRES